MRLQARRHTNTQYRRELCFFLYQRSSHAGCSSYRQNLNEEPELKAKDGTFDAVVCCVSVQYMQYPERVFAEIYRVLKPGGVCIMSFSNRMFYQKAIAVSTIPALVALFAP